MNNILITGIPRSGTSLAATLFDNLCDSLCLSEPQWQADVLNNNIDRVSYAASIVSDFETIRNRIKNNEALLDRRNNQGNLISNYFNQQRQSQVLQWHAVEKKLSRHFMLATKHNAHYSGVLDLLVSYDITILAIIRHPVPTILSWLSLQLPISSGRLHAGEFIWPELKAIVDNDQSVLVKQILIYNEFCKRYYKYRSLIDIINYEQLVKDKQLFSHLFDRRIEHSISLKNANKNPCYDHSKAAEIKRLIEKHGTHIHLFYADLENY